MKFLKSNVYYFVFIILFFIAAWIFDTNFNNNKVDEIKDNLGLTVAITKGFSHAATTCHIVYQYKVDGSLYLGQSSCEKNMENCKKFLLAYSKKSPSLAVILFDFPIEKSVAVGSNLDRFQPEVSIDMLDKWIEKQPTIISDDYKFGSKEKSASILDCD